jgi:hypothetical protein
MLINTSTVLASQEQHKIGSVAAEANEEEANNKLMKDYNNNFNNSNKK